MIFNKMQAFVFGDSKIAIKKEKWQLTETERIFVNDEFNSGLTCRGDEELLLWKDNPVKVGKILNRYFYNNVHMSIKQIKKAHTIGQQKDSIITVLTEYFTLMVRAIITKINNSKGLIGHWNTRTVICCREN